MIVKRKYIIISENIHNKIFTLEWLIVIRILFRIYSYFFSFWSSRAWIIHSNWFVFVLTGLGRGTYGGRSCEWSVLQHRTFVTALCCVWEAEEWLGWGLGGIMFCIFNLNKLLQDWRPTNNLFNSQIVFKLFFFFCLRISFHIFTWLKSKVLLLAAPQITHSLYEFESKCVKKYRYESFLLILHYSVHLAFRRVASYSLRFAETIPQCNIPFNLIGSLWARMWHNRRCLINELVVRSYLIIELEWICAEHCKRV